MKNKNLILIVFTIAILVLVVFGSGCIKEGNQTGTNITTTGSSAPSSPVRLIFIHHSVGENWLSDDNGKLGIALRDNNYFVSDTNYGWGPDGIGDRTDIGNWWSWFRGPESSKYLNALYTESAQNCAYSRMANNPGGENTIVIFKSCFPNSALKGNPNDPIPSIDQNPLKEQDSGSEFHTVANAKGIYIDLLEYFKTRPDKLFIVITPPPVTDPTYADNANAFSSWLKNDWLKDYPYKNVAVFDFHSVLTNGGTVLAYPSEDDHPNSEGNQKATQEFITFLNIAYNSWKQGQ